MLIGVQKLCVAIHSLIFFFVLLFASLSFLFHHRHHHHHQHHHHHHHPRCSCCSQRAVVRGRLELEWQISDGRAGLPQEAWPATAAVRPVLLQQLDLRAELFDGQEQHQPPGWVATEGRKEERKKK